MATAKTKTDAAKTEAAAPEDNGATLPTLDFVDELPEDDHEVQRSSKYHSATLALAANPGKWAVVTKAKNRNGARTRCYQLRKRYADGFEWEFRGNDVWGRAVAK